MVLLVGWLFGAERRAKVHSFFSFFGRTNKVQRCLLSWSVAPSLEKKKLSSGFNHKQLNINSVPKKISEMKSHIIIGLYISLDFRQSWADPGCSPSEYFMIFNRRYKCWKKVFSVIWSTNRVFWIMKCFNSSSWCFTSFPCSPYSPNFLHVLQSRITGLHNL